ncbi:MjaI family restriction endonuclease [Oscillibacter sp. MSJ-2]|uniref:MjaI family restriction endonuclease n=1 Tax=Dysosmobacter acutus TaxID=2841504 RepID=A0ABS6F8E0_9FIRM|nr:MjaI family restriction endonuclease [Dysosmobacter acutus]MBU5625852.1 MjaI family restriction endonuclease [Dysosmobacter acutus]
MKKKISPDARRSVTFPKYTTQLMNLANQTVKGTIPKMVGQMSELYPEYRRSTEEPSVEGWEKWYLERNPDTIDRATDKICHHIDRLREAIGLIDRDMIRNWVEDLVIFKTYQGLYYQQLILEEIAAERGEPWRLATPEEEAQGVDGYVGDQAYSVKPSTYKSMDRLPETLHGKMVFYRKNAAGELVFEVEE